MCIRDRVPSYRLVDTCAAEFEAYTPYYYSTYDRGDDEVKGNTAKKVMILGGGPNRIGQGIEFDYCCVHAAFALKEDCLLYTSDAADERSSVDLGGRRIIKKKKINNV